MKIKNAPRDAGELLQLSTPKRFELFRKLSQSEEEANAFLAAPNETQAMVLAQRLALRDEELAPSFITECVTLPVRTTNEKKNKKRLLKFSRRIEKTINNMKDDGYGQFNMLQFDQHGLIVLGHRQLATPFGLPPELLARMGHPMSLPVPEPEEAGDDDVVAHMPTFRIQDPMMKQRLVQLCSRAFNIVESHDTDEKKDKDLSEWVDAHMGEAPAEVTKIFIKEIDRLHHEHLITGDHDEECALTSAFSKVKALLEQRVHLATN